LLDKIAEVSAEGKLKSHHYQAIELILSGKSDQEIGDELNLARETVNRWKNSNYHFMAELNRRRAILWDSASDRLRAMVDMAIDIIYEELLSNGDFKTAMEFLKAIGIYGQVNKPSGQTDPRMMIIDDAHEKADIVMGKVLQSGKSQKQRELIKLFIEESFQKMEGD